MKTPKPKPEDKPSMKVLKTATCKTLSGKSTLTYQIGATPDSTVHLRISKNSGGGFFSQEWIAFDDIQEILKERPRGTPVLAHLLTPLLKGKSVNTSAFLLAALSHLKLLRPLPKKKRHHELMDPKPFLDQVEKLMATGNVKAKAPVKKTVKKTAGKPTGASTKKAAVKKRAMAKRKKTTTRTRKASPAQS